MHGHAAPGNFCVPQTPLQCSLVKDSAPEIQSDCMNYSNNSICLQGVVYSLSSPALTDPRPFLRSHDASITPPFKLLSGDKGLKTPDENPIIQMCPTSKECRIT